MDFSKINELKSYDLNCNIFDVYSYDGLSMQELLCQFFTKINDCIKTSNETIDLAEWLVNEGLKQEVVIKLTTWLNDGTLENLINVTLFENLNNKIDNVSSQLEHNTNDINSKISNVLNLSSDLILLKNKTSLNDIKTKNFNNCIINFENNLLTLDSDLELVFNNCTIMNLNVSIKQYNSLKISGSNYHIINCTINGNEAFTDYFNVNDVDKPMFIPLTLSGDNFSLKYSLINNLISRQALMIKNADTFEISHNKIIDCYSYNRVNHSNNKGGFDNYGDGIYVGYSKNGVINNNKVINSTKNAVGRCGICVEFDANNIEVSTNEVSGYDRGIHIELTTDNIKVIDNIVNACNVCLMCWNVNKCNVIFKNNKCTNKGLDKNNTSHNSILTYGISIISVLGDYSENQTNGNNVIFESNEVLCVENAKYKTLLTVENALPVKFINNKLLRENENFNPSIVIGSDNNNRVYNLYMDGNIIQTTLPLVYIDNMYINNNDILSINYFEKSSEMTTIKSIYSRQLTNNIIRSNNYNGGTALYVYSSIIKNNIFENISGDYIISSTSAYKICEGNKFIKYNEGGLDFNLIRNGGRWTYGSTSPYISGCNNNIFIDTINNLIIEVKPNGTVL